MKALVLKNPCEGVIESVAEPLRAAEQVLLRVQSVGLCGSDLDSFRGKNPLIAFPRILGHEVAATVVEESSVAIAPKDLQKLWCASTDMRAEKNRRC
jgi:threonine dehydrogenase-like Zn-dependent dehydrogenase